MSVHADLDLGVHQGRRRILELDTDDAGIVNQDIAAAGVVDSNELYAPGFTHFVGQIVTDTPASTTLEISVIPRIIGALGGGGIATNSQFIVATITTIVGIARYSFYWGEGRGLLTEPGGATYCFSPIFRVHIVNTGANMANNTTLEALVCQ